MRRAVSRSRSEMPPPPEAVDPLRRQLRAAAGLAAFLLLVGIGINQGLPRLPWQPQFITTLDYTSAWWGGVAHQDSWMPMREALVYLDGADEASDAKLLYEEILFERGIKLQYPPMSLLPVDALRRTAVGADDPVLNGISWVAVLGCALFSAAIFVVASRRLDPARGGAVDAVEFVLVAAAGLAFYPLVRGYYLGQIQTWIDFLTAAVALAWLLGGRGSAGVLAGLACLIKPQLGVALLWAAARGHWRFAVGQVCVVGVAVVASVLLYGFANHVDYAEALAFLGRHGEGFHPNQSVNGLLNRMLDNGNNLEWEGSSFAPFHPFVYGATVATSLALLAGALLWRRRALVATRSEPAALADLGLLIVTVTLASPIAWTHHYGALLPVFALALPLARAARLSWLGLVPLALAWLLIADNFRVFNRLADTPWNFLQSYVFFGGLLLLGWLYRVRDLALCERVRE